jgi:hypothetical protein
MWTPLAAVASLLLSSAGPADAPAPQRVARLIEQLGSPDFLTREAATKELEAVGAPALPALKAATGAEDAETARRAAELATKIARRIDNEKTLAPSLVELDFEDVPLAAVLAELQKKTGALLPLGDAAALQKKVTVQTGGPVPFWDAVAKVCDAAGLEVAASAAATAPGPMEAQRQAEAALLQAEAARAAAAADALQAARLKELAEQAEQARKAAAEKAGKGDPAEDRKKAEELQKQRAAMEAALQRLVAQRVAAQQIQLQARAGGFDRAGRSNPMVPPPDSGVIALRPKSDKPNPACVCGAVRVEAVPFPAAALATVPRDIVPVVLSATPEPKLQWVRVEAVRVDRAADDAGRELTAAAAVDPTVPTRVMPVQGGVLVADINGAVNLLPNPGPTPVAGYAPTATQALVRLRTADGPPKTIKSLEGVVRGVVRTGPEEIAAVAGLGRFPATAVGPNGVALTVASVTARDDDESFEIDVTVRYNAAEVQPAGRANPAETMIHQAGGRAIVRAQVRGVVVVGGAPGRVEARPADSGGEECLFGLTVTDADGKPFTLTAASSLRRIDQASSEVTDQLKLAARPTGKDQGKPARVAFSGRRTKVVEIPFKLSDVPAAAGTGEVSDELRKKPGDDR